ncbi:MAG: gamma-glutamyl-gamma-aminobutyrate hydrolase family protein [Rhizobiales bacterium]|nr:gamma-glutamyl-gamma-aminobutyrate hydrolase family protein [Hyphomicrobiales bacterium]
MTQPTPIIAVAADYKELDNYRWHAAAETYLRAIIVGLGGIPLIVPSLAGDIDLDALLDRVDGVLLPGSKSNVHPSRYGEAPSPASEPYDVKRDAMAFALIRAAIARGVPLFAICRGFQELNVALGGTLIPEVQDLPGRHDHRAPVSDDQTVRFAIRQDVQVTPGSELAGIVGEGSKRVNSLHRQAIGTLGENLSVEATAPDGTVEAVRVRNARGFAIGVQWHPEYWVESDETSARLFAAFGRAVRTYMAARDGLPVAAE